MKPEEERKDCDKLGDWLKKIKFKVRNWGRPGKFLTELLIPPAVEIGDGWGKKLEQ